MSNKKMGLTGASTQTLRGELRRNYAFQKLDEKYNDKIKHLFGPDYKNPVHQKKKKNTANALNRLDRITNKYQDKIDKSQTPLSKAFDKVEKVGKTMGNFVNAGKVIVPISGLLIARDMLKAKPAGTDSTLYKVKDYKRN